MAGAWLLRLTGEGKRVAYYKPFSPASEADRDVAFMSQLLTKGRSDEGDLASAPVPLPLLLGPAQLRNGRLDDEQLRGVADTIARLNSAFDAVLVEWASPAGVGADGAITNFPPALAGHPILLLCGYNVGMDGGRQAAAIAEIAQRLGEDLAGVIINGVLRHRRREVDLEMVAPLREQGVPLLGAIPEDRELLSLTVQQVADCLGGRWIQEPPDAETWIDRFLIGGNIMDSGPGYFGRYPNQAVITRADRPDIQLTSLMCNTKFLVLTGREEPTEYIRVEAQKRAAALLLVAGNTLDIAESLGGLLEQANPYSQHKLSRFAALMEQLLITNPMSKICQ